MSNVLKNFSPLNILVNMHLPGRFYNNLQAVSGVMSINALKILSN